MPVMSFGVLAVLACGGFFCDTGGGPAPRGEAPPPAPPVQSSERVIFVHEPGRVTAYVQVTWTGDPLQFAWVVPVPAKPELGVAPTGLFDALDRATAPRFTFRRSRTTETVVDNGESSSGCGGGSSGGGTQTVTSTSEEIEDRDEVQVLGQADVGPYETATLSAESATTLAEWLTANGYTMPPTAPAVLQKYVARDSVFVALKLRPEAGGEPLVPILLRYAGDEPCIPLRITSLSTAPMLTVNAIVIGDQRWLPSTWREAYPDHDAVRPDDFAPTTYSHEVEVAVRNAGGRAFVTEYAGPTAELLGQVGDPDARDLLGRGRYLTRLFSRVRDIDLTVDPMFYRPDTPQRDISNRHSVDLRGTRWALPTERRHVVLETAPALGPGLLPLLPWLSARLRRASRPRR